MAESTAGQRGRKPRKGRQAPEASGGTNPADVAAPSQKMAEAAGEPTDVPAGADESDDVAADRPVRRGTTRTVKREETSHVSETHEVVEDFEVPPLMDRVGGDFPAHVG